MLSEATRRQTFMKISRNGLNWSAKVGPESQFVTQLFRGGVTSPRYLALLSQ
jgi:hypothetical protein